MSVRSAHHVFRVLWIWWRRSRTSWLGQSRFVGFAHAIERSSSKPWLHSI